MAAILTRSRADSDTKSDKEKGQTYACPGKATPPKNAAE